ncbi:hypothetical protein [Paenisporosarcina sp. OV554]|uniref:hypothetical protein n=1 Tax=Paenisporosarcina sp. OV554 TaxID=2135694 RepID=UPI000D38982C|nr:hypothetical protein [Paenisporosarcina sp. OV554]PUB10082.1 hypothetical protein C8K15_1219 [Paenisporosarcina sp. OV554]
MPFYPQNPNPWPYQSFSRPNYWEQSQFQPVYQDPRQFQPVYQDPRQFQPYPGPTFQGPRGITPGQNFGPPQEDYYSQRPSMWGNINQMMTTAGKISNGVNTLRQMSSVFSSFRRLP